MRFELRIVDFRSVLAAREEGGEDVLALCGNAARPLTSTPDRSASARPVRDRA